jgi:hypothetical protein
MIEDAETIIRRTYAEANLAAKEKGLSGLGAAKAVKAATVKVASRLLGRTVTEEEVERVMRS